MTSKGHSRERTASCSIRRAAPASGVTLMVNSGLEKQAAIPMYYCLSENVAKTLPGQWQRRVAKTPDEAAMLALLD